MTNCLCNNKKHDIDCPAYRRSKYEYSDPTHRGYTKITLTKDEHNRLFSNRPRSIFHHYDYYVASNPDCIEMHVTSSLLSKTLSFLTLPIALVWYGLSNAKETLQDHLYLFNEKKYGKFLKEVRWSK